MLGREVVEVDVVVLVRELFGVCEAERDLAFAVAGARPDALARIHKIV